MKSIFKSFSMDENIVRPEIVSVWNAQSVKLCFRKEKQKWRQTKPNLRSQKLLGEHP